MPMMTPMMTTTPTTTTPSRRLSRETRRASTSTPPRASSSASFTAVECGRAVGRPNRSVPTPWRVVARPHPHTTDHHSSITRLQHTSTPERYETVHVRVYVDIYYVSRSSLVVRARVEYLVDDARQKEKKERDATGGKPARRMRRDGCDAIRLDTRARVSLSRRRRRPSPPPPPRRRRAMTSAREGRRRR